MDVFNYYPPANNRFCEIEGSGEESRDSDDSKVACQKIKIGAEIGISGLICAGVKFILEKVDWSNLRNRTQVITQRPQYKAGNPSLYVRDMRVRPKGLWDAKLLWPNGLKMMTAKSISLMSSQRELMAKRLKLTHSINSLVEISLKPLNEFVG